jgi:hypothetical protein
VWWYAHIILGTQEAEIGRITVEASLGKKFLRPHLNRKSLTWWCAHVILAKQEVEIRGQYQQKVIPHLKITTAKRAG